MEEAKEGVQRGPGLARFDRDDIRYIVRPEGGSSVGQDREFRLNYDRGTDTLYVTFLPGVPAITRETEEGVLVRVDPETDEIVGITVLGFSTFELDKGVNVGHMKGSLRMDASPALA